MGVALLLGAACGSDRDDDMASTDGADDGASSGADDTTAATTGATDGGSMTSDGDGSDGSDNDSDGGDSTGATADCPHPLYPGLDLCDLPGDGGGVVCGAYEPPELPNTTRTVTIESTGQQAALDVLDACQTPATAVEVPDAAGRIGALTLGGVDDCDVTLGDDVIVDFLLFGQNPGPMHAPSHRVRVRGGHIASVSSAGGSTDLVLQGVTIDNGVVPSDQRGSSGIVLHNDGPDSVVERFAIVDSIIRAVPGIPDENGATHGIGYLGALPRNVLFANNNIVTAGNLNSWGFRIGGGCNVLLIDNTVRVSFHKLVRLNDADTDYVYIRGGTWMREATVDPFGNANNDAFKELNGDWRTDHVYIHDPVVYLQPQDPVAFGAANNPGNADTMWEARGIEWHAVNESVVSDAYLTEHAGYCTPGADCDYGIGTHSYHYDPALTFPEDPWRELPGLPEDNPDLLPVEP